jgi:hypothetical protein
LTTPISALFISRGMMAFTPYLLLTIAAGCLFLIKRSRLWIPILLMALLTLPVGGVLFRNSTTEHPTEYKGLAEKWIPEIRESDLIFVRQHWWTTPIFYYLDFEKYQFIGNLQPNDYAEAVRANPDSRVWVLYNQSITPELSAREALAGYKITRRFEAMDINVDLYEKQPSGP